jgi:hypothetical protein
MTREVARKDGLTKELRGLGAEEVNTHFRSWQFLTIGKTSNMAARTTSNMAPNEERIAPDFMNNVKLN